MMFLLTIYNFDPDVIQTTVSKQAYFTYNHFKR